MDLFEKLQLHSADTIRLIEPPGEIASQLADHVAPDGNGILAFVRTSADLQRSLEAVVLAARADRSTWVAYPKAGQLGTDLNRDSLAAALRSHGIRPVRQVALDPTWSALRFRPA